jgi:hypothetical protein
VRPATKAWLNEDWRVGNKNWASQNGQVAMLHSTNAPDETNHCGGARNNGTGNRQQEVVVWQIK